MSPFFSLPADSHHGITNSEDSTLGATKFLPIILNGLLSEFLRGQRDGSDRHSVTLQEDRLNRNAGQDFAICGINSPYTSVSRISRPLKR